MRVGTSGAWTLVRQLMPEFVMNDQNFTLALGVATLFVEFAIDFALTGDPDHAFRLVADCHESEQNDSESVENLFWD